MITHTLWVVGLLGLPSLPALTQNMLIGHTEIMKWPSGNTTAVSITYDGGTINQFRVAVPLMNRLGIPATFFIVTGDITGSEYQGKFLGRPVEEILKDSITRPIDRENFFERATALRYLPYEGARSAHTRAGDLFELGKVEDAYREIEDAYAKIRSGEAEPLDPRVAYENPTVDISWEELRTIAAQGHEFGSHSITHPQLSICDDANLRYELEKSREELRNQLGPRYTFSAECPHGIESKRVMDIVLAIYPATRNRMPEAFLEEINRWSQQDPTASEKEYVQWQRGPKTSTPLEEMKSWVDTCLASNNIWLVLTFHGIDGIGYEPKTGEEIEAYFQYLKENEEKAWLATFQDVAKYIRERMSARTNQSVEPDCIRVSLTHSLDPKLYDLPLTLKTYVPVEWDSITVKQGNLSRSVARQSDSEGSFILYPAVPNGEQIAIQP